MLYFPSFIEFLGVTETLVILAFVLIVYLALKKTRGLK